MEVTLKEIQLTQGKVTLVDDEDYDELMDYKWYFIKVYKSYGYAARGGEKNKTVYLHREVMNPPKDMTVDHINHDTLDNRRNNLRVVTQKENSQNRTKPGTSKSTINARLRRERGIMPGIKGRKHVSKQGLRMDIAISVTPEMNTWIREQAKTRGITNSQIIRESISLMIEKTRIEK
jgi:hypothetical protein